MSKKYIKLEGDTRGVWRLTLNRPELHNAFNDLFIKELTEALEDVKKNTDVRLLVLTGEGKSFCAGADLNWMKSMKDYSDHENYQDSVRLSNLFEVLNTIEVPVIAEVNGATLGGGTGLVASCDYVISSSEAKFGFTEVGLGLVPAVISPYVMAKIGESNARAYFLSGERFSAEEALHMRLIHKVVKSDDLRGATEKQIERFLKAGPMAQIEAKKLIKGVLTRIPAGHEGVKDFTCRTIARVRTSPEGQEGMSALLEKRKPSWISAGDQS
ncbi:MAG: enoyl-CoA hydratase/isomerase family protein [Bacteriovoracaceae bacterium]|nr:enoyl-CoA hydratase/isomerase family protein [Bacteriovoracaceae bacterium]